jgi:hypothetical protein
MGWEELLAWRETMRREVEGQKPNPDSWDGTAGDRWWVEARRERDRLAGRNV